jgi:hypothetical protein
MKHRDDDYLRRRPDHQYGSSDQGYSGVPAEARNRRQRQLTAGRYGNTAERLPRDESRPFEPEDEGWSGNYVEEWRWPSRQRGPSEAGRYEDEWSRRRPVGRDPGGPGQWSEIRGYRRDQPGGYGSQSRYESRYQSRYGAGDWEPPPGYRGGGPKNYRRGDDRIHDEVCDRLAHAHELDVSEVTVRVQDGLVTLEGHIGDRRSKYDVEEIAERVFGVQDVINHIRVRHHGILASE